MFYATPLETTKGYAMKKGLFILYVITLVAGLEFCAIMKGIDGVALSTSVGAICFLTGLLFDVNIAQKVYDKIFHKKSEVNHEET